MRLSVLSSLLLAAVTSVVASDVIDLNASNFDDTVNPAELMLVEFFAPWCGHCKALAPHYEEAATALKAKNIPIAKVDCVDQSELCQKHGVAGYPTLKVFRNGTPTEYSGPRKADGIISYMVKQSLPAVAPVDAAGHEEFKKADKVVVVYYATSPSDTFKAAAEKHREDYLFGQVTDPAVIEAAGVVAPALVVYKRFDEGRNEYTKTANLDVAELSAWLKEVATPLLDEVSGENYSFYAESGLPLAYLFLDPTKENKATLLEEFTPIAKAYKGKVNFVWIDALKFAEHGKAMNLHEAKWPAFVIQNMQTQLKYPFSQAGEFSATAVEAHVAGFVAGTLEPELKSQPIPESQDESVFTLVTKQFDEIVYNDEKDVFVEFYAPWCGHCKRLKPTWDSLGDKFAPIKDKIVIAKMDATENDIPPSTPFRVQGFPTIKFKPAHSRDFIDYEGDRTLDSLVAFVEKHAKNSLEVPAAAEEVPAAEESPVVPPPAHDHHHDHAQHHEEL